MSLLHITMAILLDLQFFPNEGPDKTLEQVIRSDIVASSSGNGFLFVADAQNHIIKINHKLEPQLADVKFTPTYLRASQASPNVIVAAPEGNSYNVSLIGLARFGETDASLSNYQAEKFLLQIRTKATEHSHHFCASPSLTYIAFLTAANEIMIFKTPFSSKSRVFQQFTTTEKVHSLFITDNGTVFLVSDTSIQAYSVNTKGTTLVDKAGCQENMGFVTSNDNFAACREKLLTLYTQTTPGTFTNEILDLSNEGQDTPQKIGPVGEYIFICYPHKIQGSVQRIKIIDPIYKVRAFQMNLKSPVQFVEFQWGALVILLQGKKVVMRSEVDDQKKIDRFCEKNRCQLALKKAKELNLDASVIANIHKIQGDSYYDNGKYDQAITEYIETLGYTEPSHVIQKFVEPHHAQNLMKYLEALQAKKQATKQHTTLLFNCYTKIGATGLLEKSVNQFVRAARKGEEPSFDVETAVDVLKRNGYQQYAEQLAEAYNQHGLYLQLLYEGQNYKQILEYMQKLPGELVKKNITEYGCEIMDNYPSGRNDLTKFAVKCCTVGIKTQRRIKGKEIVKLDPNELAMIFVNNDEAYFNFLDQILQSSQEQLSEEFWNVLIEMALRAKSPKTMQLLQHPNRNYSNEQALVYFTAFNHQEGKMLIYENMELYTLILQEAPPEQCLEICVKFGDKDSSLWSDALVKLSRADCDSSILAAFLEKVQEKEALPFLTILKVLRGAKKHTFATVLPIVQATFKREQQLLHEAEHQLEECNEQSKQNKEVIKKLSTQNFVINQSKCSSCQNDIESESRHFMCGHSFHLMCLGDSDDFCPICRDGYEKIVEEKIKKMESARSKRNVQQMVSEAGDGFSFLLDQVSSSLFASGIDLMSVKQDNAKITEAKNLLHRMSPGS